MFPTSPMRRQTTGSSRQSSRAPSGISRESEQRTGAARYAVV